MYCVLVVFFFFKYFKIKIPSFFEINKLLRKCVTLICFWNFMSSAVVFSLLDIFRQAADLTMVSEMHQYEDPFLCKFFFQKVDIKMRKNNHH